MTETTLDVYWGSTATLVGRAYLTTGRQTATTFLYDEAYIRDGGVNIDPALQLVTGTQYVPRLLPALADTAPDRWGRNLLDKAERARALSEGRRARSLEDVDYLLGVSDDTRQGALRFSTDGGKTFLGIDGNVPKLVALPRLLRSSDQLACDDDSLEALKDLLDTGTTGLGGARPKASVLLDDGALAIAKFPHPSDRWDVMAWEALTLDLLATAGIRVPDHQLVRLGERSVLLLRRFDRAEDGERVGYISALTAVGADDGEHRDYIDITDAIKDLSNRTRADLAELFRRVVASVALGNTDDHLRNHGFLSRDGFWSLSPAFDVNPTPDVSKRRATSIAGADSIDNEVDGLLAFAEDCDLTAAQAREHIDAVAGALADWDARAARAGIPAAQVNLMGESIRPRLEQVNAAAG